MTLKTFRVIIAGSRGFNDYELLEKKCDEILTGKVQLYEIVIISGNAQGADSLGETYALRNGFELKRMPADWNEYGKGAGVIRNSQMATYADALIAFHDGQSPGTKHMINEMKCHGKPYRVILYGKYGDLTCQEKN